MMSSRITEMVKGLKFMDKMLQLLIVMVGTKFNKSH